jgi:phosphoenolpyruvate carboxykinase (ATP)
MGYCPVFRPLVLKTTLSADPAKNESVMMSMDGVRKVFSTLKMGTAWLDYLRVPNQRYLLARAALNHLENVVHDPLMQSGLDDDNTENTRASYPLDYIDNAIPEKMGGHPENIIFLTCDASGVMPPIARLTPDQALYHFISGYTAKVGGTEIGLGEEPEITFSACFGAPFMVLPPSFYADLLKRKILRYRLIAGWSIPAGLRLYGVGKRISIRYTRDLLNSALTVKLSVEYYTDPIFGFQVPKHCPGIPDSVLYPSSAWPSDDAYFKRYKACSLLYR